MIAKTLLSNNFEATLRYVYGKEGATTVDANLMAASTPDPVRIAQAMNAVAGDRVPKPCYHISLSPAQGDQLEMNDWRSLSEEFLDRLGASHHPSVAVLHRDATYPDGEERPHLHLVINRFESPSPSARALCLHFPKIERVIRKLEQDYQLESIPSSWEVDRRGDAPPQVHRTEREETPSIRTQIQAAIDRVMPQAASIDEFVESLQDEGVTARLSTQGISFEKDGIHFGGYQLGKAYTRNRIQEGLEMTSTVIQSDQNANWENGDTVIQPSAAEPTPPRRAMSMAEVMQQASSNDELIDNRVEAQPATSQAEPETSEPTTPNPPRSAPEPRSPFLGNLGNTLEGTGQTIAAHQDGVDGMMLGGSVVQLAGAAVTLADAFLKHLEAAREKAQSERAQALLDQLEQIGERTSRLESSVASRSEAAIEAEAAESQTVVQSANVQSANAEADALGESFNAAAQRLDRLEEAAGLPIEEHQPIQFDRNLPIEAQLDQMEAAIGQLNERLEKLEAVVLTTEAEQTSAPAAPQDVAEHLANYVQARAQYYNLVPTEPVATRTMGTIEYSNSGGDELIAIVEPEYGAKFEAVKLNGEWEIVSNDLSEREAQAIVELPQTLAAYESIAQSKELIRYFQEHTPQEFEGDRGKVVWKDEEKEFSYRFDITSNQDDSKTVIGVDHTEKSVLQARLGADGSIQVEQAEIPKSHAESLLFQPNPIVERERASFKSEPDQSDEPSQSPPAQTTEPKRSRPSKQRERRRNQELSL